MSLLLFSPSPGGNFYSISNGGEMVRSGVRLYILSISLAISMLGVNVFAQGKPEKEKSASAMPRGL
jgi:hypothetical protein